MCNNAISYSKRLNKFCSAECVSQNLKLNNPSKSLTGIKLIEKNKKIKDTLKLNHIKKVHKLIEKEGCDPLKYNIKTCKQCNIEFYSNRKGKQYCSLSCVYDSKKRDISNTYKWYRKLSTFKFNLKSYPDEYDFKLLETYGWYGPHNRGNNINGVSRDHIISVNYGYRNSINPLILAHPANCQLLKHSHNIKKSNKNIMSLEIMLAKIKDWDKKYGNYYTFELDTFIDLNNSLLKLNSLLNNY
jgi:hypothetical protein